MLNVLFFAQLRERLGCERLLAEDAADVAGLVGWLASERGPAWEAALAQEDLIVAVNQVVVGHDARMQAMTHGRLRIAIAAASPGRMPHSFASPLASASAAAKNAAKRSP